MSVHSPLRHICKYYITKIDPNVNVKLDKIGIVHGTILNLNSDYPVEFQDTSKGVYELTFRNSGIYARCKI